MLKPAMNKHFIAIILLLLCVLLSGPAEARLTLGVVTGPSGIPGQITSDQARSLANLLAEKLQEDVVLNELSDQATLINGIDQFATLDLALLPTQDVREYSDRFLLIGQFDGQKELSLVCRLDAVGDLAQRAGRIVREPGFAPWRSSTAAASPEQQIPEETLAVVEPEPVSIAPDDGTSQAAVVDERAKVGIEPKSPPMELEVETADELPPPTIEYAELVEPVTADEQGEELRDDEILALLGEDTVAYMVAQPDLPQELRPPGVPIVRPGRVVRRSTAEEDELLVASMPEPPRRTEPASPPKLLPEPEPEPGIVYIVPFVAVMVPDEVKERIFDQFVDLLNQEGKDKDINLQFLILKQGLQNVTSEWLAVRKYVTGEIYAYVEDAGSTSTELRAKVRMTYRRPNQKAPAFGFEYPVKSFFDNNHSSLDIERLKLSEDIAVTLADKLLKALKD